MTPTPTPTPTMGLIGALVFIGGALTGALVGAAFTARQAREEPTGNNGTRNGTQRRPPPPSGDPLRDLEDGGVEGGENGGGRGEEERKNMIFLIVMLAIRTTITVMRMFKIGSGTNITVLLELFLCFGFIVYVFFVIFRLSRLFHGFR